MKILSLNYQRNGVSGEPFFCAEVLIEKSKSMDGLEHRLIATFREPKGNKYLDVRSCRAVEPNSIMDGWRGDCVGESIRKLFHESGCETYSEWMESIRTVVSGFKRKALTK